MLDFVGLRVGMLLAVAIWTGASASHALMGSFAGFAAARAVLGLGEGATFPGGLRTAVESLPAHLRARAIALSFSGGTIGAVMMPLLLGPLAIQYGWRAAFITTAGLGAAWLVIWADHCPPAVPAQGGAQDGEGGVAEFPGTPRLGADLQLRAAGDLAGPGPDDSRAVSQRTAEPHAGGSEPARVDSPADLGHRLLLLGLGGRPLRGRPTSVQWGCSCCSPRISLTLGFTTATTSVPLAMAIISLSTFIGGGFQMVALKVGSYAFPREQAAMMTGIASGSWSLVNFLLLRAIGQWSGWINGNRWEEIFWLIAVLPVVGIAVWLVLSRDRTPHVLVTRSAALSGPRQGANPSLPPTTLRPSGSALASRNEPPPRRIQRNTPTPTHPPSFGCTTSTQPPPPHLRGGGQHNICPMGEGRRYTTAKIADPATKQPAVRNIFLADGGEVSIKALLTSVSQ